MKRLVALISVAMMLLVPASADASLLHQSRRFAKQLASDNCHRELRCTRWRVFGCWWHSHSKVYCDTAERFGFYPRNRDCYYKTIIKVHPKILYAHDGYVRCYNSSGDLIAKGPPGNTHPV